MNELLDRGRLPGVGVVIGRFQTPYLHNGHKKILEAANRHEKLLVLLGCHSAPLSDGNELDFETRQYMLRQHSPRAVILPLHDMPTNDVWSQQVDSVIRGCFPFDTPSIYHGRDSFAPCYEGTHKERLVHVQEDLKQSGTELREHTKNRALETEDFRCGVFYAAAHRYPRVNPTVDIAVTRKIDEKLHVLLGRKPRDPRGWRFPGGYVDITDPDLETTVKREVEEETGLSVEDPTYICSRRIEDWRDTATNRNMTAFFHCEHMWGPAKAGDDLCEVKWFALDELSKVKIIHEHQILLKKFNAYLRKQGK